MMKIYSLVLAGLVLCLVSAGDCFGDGQTLGYKIKYQAENGRSGWQEITIFAGLEGAGKGFDGENVWPSVPSSGILLGVRKINGTDDWNGTTGFYVNDIREKIAPGTSVIVDGIYMWAVPGTPSQDMHLSRSCEPFLDSGVNCSLSLLSVPQGVEYTGPTSWGSETSEITLPFYSSDNGETGYKFRLTVSASQ